MATRKRLNAPQGRIQTRLQANRALILSAPVLDQLEAQPQEPRWGPSLEVRSVPWWEGWPVRYSVAERVMLPAKPRIRLSRNSTGRTSTKLALITSQVEPLTITSLPIGTGGRTRRNQNSRRRASMKLSLSSISAGLPSPARLCASPGSIPKVQLETRGTVCAEAASRHSTGGRRCLSVLQSFLRSPGSLDLRCFTPRGLRFTFS